MPRHNPQEITASSSYRLAYTDVEFMMDPRQRPIRMELEFLKPDEAFQKLDIQSTIVVFGSTRIIEPTAAQKRLEAAEAELARSPDDWRRQRAVAQARRLAALRRR